MPARLVLALAALAAVAVAVPLSSAAGTAPSAPSSGSCAILAQPPFLYSVVIPLSSVECLEAQRRLRVETQLTRDGVTVAHATRTCRNTSVCWLTVDSSAPDEPGDQVWCTVAKGYAGTSFLGEARSCETEEF
jgi:hypothetical protein